MYSLCLPLIYGKSTLYLFSEKRVRLAKVQDSFFWIRCERNFNVVRKKEKKMASASKLIAISVLLIVVLLVILVIISTPSLLERSGLEGSTALPTLGGNAQTATGPNTVTNVVTTTRLSTSVTTITKNYTTTTLSTTTLLPAAIPQLVKSNAYFLTTPVDMMAWNQSYFDSFTQHLIKANVTYLYFNLPNLNQDASLIVRFDVLATAANRPFQYIAWTGTQTDPNATLANFTTAGVDETVNSVYKAGFDGILLDLEPVPNDSPQFLNMLIAFRSAIDQYAPGMLLGANSMAVYYGESYGHEWGWDPNYFQRVTSLVNYVSPMLFESGARNYSAYIQYAETQIQITSQYSKAAIMYAIPDWYANTTWHDPLGENLSNAVTAFQLYLSNQNPPPMMMGLAIYGLNKTYVLTPNTVTQALETTPQDWSVFINQWVNTNYPSKIGSGLA